MSSLKAEAWVFDDENRFDDITSMLFIEIFKMVNNCWNYVVFRFDFQRLFGGKISKAVGFDETLDLSPFLSNKPVCAILFYDSLHF